MTRAQVTSEIGGQARGMPGPYRVVLVEDPAIAAVLKRLFEMLGQQVATADTGRGGIELVMETQPDVVFARIELPDMDGFQFAREVRSGCAKRPVLVAHTGYNKSEIAKKAKEAGFDLYVMKPMTLEQLRSVFSFVAGESGCEQILL
jgi:CheY-like chemotaxis protein